MMPTGTETAMTHTLQTQFQQQQLQQQQQQQFQQQQQQQQQQSIMYQQQIHPALMQSYQRSMMHGLPLNQPPIGMAGKDTRKKRIHASKSQLAILESSFQACPKPTSKARKVISEKVHLNERCVQIWFQNRRARQKKMLALEQQNTDGGMDGNGSASDSPMTPRTPTAGGRRHSSTTNFSSLSSTLSNTASASMARSLLDSETLGGAAGGASGLMSARRFSMPDISTKNNNNNAYSMAAAAAAVATSSAAAAASSLVPQPNDAGLMYCETFKASSIAIGTWRRISMTQGDLICALDPVRRTLRWMVVESTYGFQMEVPLFSILDVSVGRHTANVAILTIDIATQPAFSKEVRMGTGQSIWVPCDDFTEGAQASICRRHQLFTAASDPVILSFLAMVPHTSAGAAAAQAGLIPSQGSPLMSSTTTMTPSDMTSTASAASNTSEINFRSLLSPHVGLPASLMTPISTSSSMEMPMDLGFNDMDTPKSTTSSIPTLTIDQPTGPNLPPILTDFANMRGNPTLFSATTPHSTSTAYPTSSGLTTPSLSSPPSATSSLSTAPSSIFPNPISSGRRQSCPNLTLAAKGRPVPPSASSSSASPLHRHLHNSLATSLTTPAPTDLPLFQRARSSSLSGLELIFQQHAIRSPLVGARGKEGSVTPTGAGSPLIPPPILEVPEPLSPPNGLGVIAEGMEGMLGQVEAM